jgi:hypothetical protein
MYISLKTYEIWRINGKFTPKHFFQAIPSITAPGDLVVVGAYNCSETIYEWLSKNEIPLKKPKPFDDDCFDINRDEYPKGRSFCLPISDRNLE